VIQSFLNKTVISYPIKTERQDIIKNDIFQHVFIACENNPAIDTWSFYKREIQQPTSKPFMFVKQMKHTRIGKVATLTPNYIRTWLHEAKQRLRKYEHEFNIVYIFITNRDVNEEKIKALVEEEKSLAVVAKQTLHRYLSPVMQHLLLDLD